jgi:hypothetical protein
MSLIGMEIDIKLAFYLLTAAVALLFVWSLIAHVRLNKYIQSSSDLDWDVVSGLALDVQKLKKATQKWQLNENAAVKSTKKDMIEQSMMELQMRQQEKHPPRIVEL